MSSMSNFLCKTLIRVPHVLPIPPYPNLRCLQFLHLNYCTAVSDSHSFTVSYLINSCFLSPASASSASKYINFHSPEKPDAVISFFKNRGFSNSQISSIIGRHPRLLLSDPNKTLLPKFEFLHSKGASLSDVSKIIVKAPNILSRSVPKHLAPTFDFLKGYLQSNERTIASIKRFPDCCQKYLNGSVKILLDAGVSEANIMYFLLYQPRMFYKSQDRFREIVKDVLKMGFDPSKLNFIQAVFCIRALSKTTWSRKLEVYKRWGLSEERILAAFKNYPLCMRISEEKIMSGMDLFINKLGWEAAAIAKNPTLLTYSLENRTIPRASVLMFLFQNGLTEKPKFMLVTPFSHTEDQFLQKFVHPYLEKVPQLSKLYHVKVHDGINRL